MHIYIPARIVPEIRRAAILLDAAELQVEAQTLLNAAYAKRIKVLNIKPMVEKLIAKLQQNPALLRQNVYHPNNLSSSQLPMYLRLAEILQSNLYTTQLWTWFKEMPEFFALNHFHLRNVDQFSWLILNEYLGKVSAEELITTIQKLSRRHSNQIFENLAFHFWTNALDETFDLDQIVGMYEVANCMRFSGVCDEEEIAILAKMARAPHLPLVNFYRNEIQEAINNGTVDVLVKRLKLLTEIVSAENKPMLARAIVDKLSNYGFDDLIASQKSVLRPPRKRARYG